MTWNNRIRISSTRSRPSGPPARTLLNWGGQTEWTLQTPGIGLRLALDYYRFEAFATMRERDARCGPTAHQDVRYAPATTTDLRSNGITIDMIACGHDIDHPMFDAVVSPLFDAAFGRLIREVVDSPKGTKA
jgi:hypothetical protein